MSHGAGEGGWSVPSTEKWKSTDSLILPLAFLVTTHLEVFCFVFFSPSLLGCPSLPGPSPWVPKLQSTREPLGTKLCPAVSPLPVRRSYLFYDRDMVHGFLLSRAPGGGHVGEEVRARRTQHRSWCPALGPWVSTIPPPQNRKGTSPRLAQWL